MERITKTVTYSEAGKIQMNAAQFDCEIIELGVVGGGNARITIEGTPENTDKLFQYIAEAGNYESKETATV